MTQLSRRTQWVLLAFAVAVIGYSTYCLVDAVHQARATGLVEIVPGHKGKKPPRVPWPNAWAYFAGLALFIVAGALLVAYELRRYRVVIAAVMAFVAALLLCMLSDLLSSLAGAAYLAGALTAIGIACLVNERFGRTAALWVWALVVLVAMLQAWNW